MAVTTNPSASLEFTDRRLIALGPKALAANAGSTEVLSIPIPRGKQCIIRAILVGAAGVVIAPFAVTADASLDTLTATAHSLLVGQPVYVVGTGQPGGVTATTIYYAGVITANTFKLYDTKANAVTGSATGLIDITTTGSAVFVTSTVENASYTLFGAAHNRNNNVTAIGSVNVISLEDVAAWDATITADDTNKAMSVKVTPDATLASVYTGWYEVYETTLVPSAV